jgi:hypothetical protein
MPPVLILEDGSGVPGANSYVTAAMFDTYVDRIPTVYKASYLLLDQYTKEQLAIWATQGIETNIIWPTGTYRSHPSQALQFPRIGMYDPDGVYILDYRSIPMFLKDGVCQYMFELGKTDLLVEPPRGITSIKVGPITLDFDKDHGNDPRAIPRSVFASFLPYGGVPRGSKRIRSVPLYRA